MREVRQTCTYCNGERQVYGGDKPIPCGRCNGQGWTNVIKYDDVEGCFPSGTKVTTPLGLRDISALKDGDFVISVDPNSNKNQICKILKVLKHRNNRIWLIQFADGHQVRTTSVHSFFCNGEWRRASAIKVSDTITAYDEAEGFISRVVKSSFATNDVEDVYNIIVESKFNFLADGVIAHSFSYLRSLRMFMWSLRRFGHNSALQSAELRA